MKDGYEIVVGLDISSSTIGWSVLKIKKSIIYFIATGYIKPIKHENILVRLADTRNKIQKLFEMFDPDCIAIENIISFIRGKSTANTIITLATFNRMIGLLALDFLKKPPELHGVLAIRHGLKLTKEFPAKEEMPEIVATHLNLKFPWEYNKKGKIKVESYDKADGIAVALFQAFCMTGKCRAKAKLPKKKKSIIKK